MVTESYRSGVIRYITERRCPDGGFCFYRLNEPNAADTFYAVSSLTLLGEHFSDDVTVSWLLGLQQDDGSYPTLYVGYYALKSLATLGIRPRIVPDTWIGSINPSAETGERPPESGSYFETSYLFSDLTRTCGIPVPEAIRSHIIRNIISHRLPDSGFGLHQSTLTETWHALAILSSFGFDHKSLGSDRFLIGCEDAELGFRINPGSRSSFLEHLHAGITIASLLGYSSWVLPKCRQIILELQAGNGGFVRSRFGGSTTLEYTFLAVSSLDLLDLMADPAGRQEFSPTGSPETMEVR